MRRPICYDITHLAARIGIQSPSGIDKVDLAYGRHFSVNATGPFVHYDVPAPRLLSRSDGQLIVEQASCAHWQGSHADEDHVFHRLRCSLMGQSQEAPTPSELQASGARLKSFTDAVLGAIHRRLILRGARGFRARGAAPNGAIYLNVSQHMFEHHRYFEWLGGRPDVLPVFLLHDLLPLDYPEFFKSEESSIFGRRLEMALRYGKAFIVTSHAVRERIRAEMASRGVAEVPMLVAPLPSSLVDGDADSLADSELATHSYFVTVGTIEPRKNHLLLLSLYREMALAAADSGQILPKLVIVGSRGWENEQVIDVLDRGRMTHPHLIEASGLSSDGLARIIANARALLMPSFAEGYGLPLVEALSVGTPVVTTDAPVFREVTQGCAIYRT